MTIKAAQILDVEEKAARGRRKTPEADKTAGAGAEEQTREQKEEQKEEQEEEESQTE